MSSALTPPTYTTIKLDSQASYEEINDKLDTAVDFLNTLYDNCIYRAGDSINAGLLTTAGYVTGSGTEVRWHIPLAHIPTASKVSITGTLYIRQNGKYHYNGKSTTSESTGAIKITTSNTSCGLKKNGIGVYFSVGSLPDIINNHACGIKLDDTVITFS